jgi:DNA invertase Pin-like site-specific DNA recombinase
LLQEEQKKARKLEKEQKKLLEQEQQRAKSILEQKQIQLMHNLFAAGLSTDIIAKSLEVSIEQIKVWQKVKK